MKILLKKFTSPYPPFKRELVRSIKFSLIFLCMLISFTVVNAQEPLNEYLETAAKNNPELISKYNDYLAALEVVPQVGALTDPQISFSYFIQPVETRLGPQKAKISLNQMLPWFGFLRFKEDAQTNKAKARFEEFEETKSKLFLNIKSMYFDIYFVDKSLDITNKNIEILNSLKSLIQTKIETGNISTLDEIYLEMEIAELQNQQYLIQDELNVLQIQFNNLLNTSEFQNIQISDSLNNSDLTFSKQEIIDLIRSNNHQLKNINYISESYQSEITASKKSAYPSFSFGIDYIFTDKNIALQNSADNGKDAIIFPTISFNIPLFSSKYSSKIRQSELQKISSDNRQFAKTNEIESLFESVYKDYNDANRKQKLFINQLELTNNAMQILRSRYETGSVDIEDLLNMERKILMYSLLLEKSIKEKHTSIAFINYLMGN